MREIIVLAHGMRNFGHNSDSATIVEQERVIRAGLEEPYSLIGAYGDKGTYAMKTCKSRDQIRDQVLGALNKRYEVKEVVVVEKDDLRIGLYHLTNLCKGMYDEDFCELDYSVVKDLKRWRMGFVFFGPLYENRISYVEELAVLDHTRVEILTVVMGLVGVLKFDEPPRYPWGKAAEVIEKGLASAGANWIGTGRSAQTIRGVLDL